MDVSTKIPDIAVPRPPPSKMSLKHIIQRNLPVENEMLKLQSSRFAFQYKDQMDHLSHVHREYDSFAKELTSEYRKLQNTLVCVEEKRFFVYSFIYFSSVVEGETNQRNG